MRHCTYYKHNTPHSSFMQTQENLKFHFTFCRFPFLTNAPLVFILKRFQCLFLLFGSYVKIYHCRLDILMPKQIRDLGNVHAVFKPMGCFGVPELMRMYVQRNVTAFAMRHLCVPFQHFINIFRRHGRYIPLLFELKSNASASPGLG